MGKQLPKRAGSRAQYVFWMIVAVTFACMADAAPGQAAG